MPSQPTRIGKYDVIRVIGRGGMGMVYQAVDPTIGRMVAIKTVTAVLSDDPEFLKRFYREAQSTGKLQHPNIVTLYDLGEQDGVPYLVMEYLEGDSLEKIIREKRQYAVADKLNILIQVCEGLGYAHQRQIIHRDVKPANIVVLNDGGVKIVDFGIAQFGNERFTRTGQVIGSMYYMSPEQIQDADIDSRSDIYSAGVVLFEFLSGALPFQGKDPTSTLAKILNEPPPSLAPFVDAYPEELNQIVRRALAKQRSERYTSMEDFAFDLRTMQERLSRDLIAKSLEAAENCVAEKDWDRARSCLRQVLKLDRQHHRANELLRQVQTQIHREEIEQQVRQFRMKADEALAVRNWDEALVALDRAIKIDGSNSELIELRDSVRRSSELLADALRRAESARRSGDLDSAKQAIEEALSVDPGNTTAKALNAILSKEMTERAKRKQVDDFVIRARKDIALRNFTSALELLRSAEAIDPAKAEVQQLIRSAAAAQEHERRRKALEQACSEIEALLNHDQYDAACDKADDALRLFPQDLGLLKLKGFAEQQRDAWNRHQFIESQLANARQLADSGELEPAQRLLNRALERYPDDAGMISLLGIVTETIARHEAEKREAERLANEKRRFLRSQLETAAELEKAGQIPQALDKLRDALFRYPDSEELKRQISVLEQALAREEAARKRAEEERAARKKSEIEKAVAESWQLLSSKQTSQAVARLELALTQYPDSTDLKSQLEFTRRRLAVEQAERDRAEQEARRRRAEIQREISAAQALVDSQQIEQAVHALEQALSRYPDDAQIQSLLQSCRQQKSIEQARREQAEKELRQRHAAIQSEIVAARQLLDANRAAESVASLERALARYSDSQELRSALAYARQRLAEEAGREKARDAERQKQVWIEEQIALTNQWLNGNQAEGAVTSLLEAVRRYPDSDKLNRQLRYAESRLAAERAERERAAQEATRRNEEIQKQIAIAREWLNSQRPDEAVATLERALQRYPDSADLRSHLEAIQTSLAREQAEKKRIAEQKQRRAADIQQEIVSARELLNANQRSAAVAALEQSTQKYPESDELRSLLGGARQILQQEIAAKEKEAREAEARRQRIATEIERAKSLLQRKQTGEAVAALEQALRQYPESGELASQLESGREQLAREKAERERKQARLARLQSEIARARNLLEKEDPEEAVKATESAIRELGKDLQLQSLLETAKTAVKLKKIEEKKLADARRREQEQERQRERDFRELQRLTESAHSASTKSALEKSLRRAREIAGRYPEDLNVHNAVIEIESALENVLAASQKTAPSQAPAATKMFASGDSAEIQRAALPPELPASVTPRAAGLAVLRNKWILVSAVSVAAAAILIVEVRNLRKPVVPEKYVFSVKTQPDGATVQVGDQTCVSPNCSLSLLPGSYIIGAQHQGYRPYAENLVINPKQPPGPMLLVLTPEPPPEAAGYLVLKVGVAGAEVVINGKRYSETSASGEQRLSLDPGLYTVEVRKKDYTQTKPAHVEITKGKETLAEFHLTPLPTQAELSIMNAAPGFKVLADGQVLGNTGPDGTFSQPLDPGSHDIRLVQEDGRQSNTIRNSFVAGQRLSLDGKRFVFQPVAPTTADVIVSNLPGAALVTVDGNSRYQADNSGTAHFKVTRGNHKLEFTADSFNPKTIQQNFSAGETSLNISLDRIDREPEEWSRVQSSNDMAAIQTFLNSYQGGKDAPKAQSRLDQLIAANTSELELRAFHDKFANTANGAVALKRADSLRVSAQHASDWKGIQAALDKFNASFQHHQERELKDVWPKAEKQYLDAMHPPAGSTFAMSLECVGDTAFSDTTAVVPCSIRTETTVPGRPKRSTTKPVHVHLYRAGGGWLIADPFGQ